MSFCQECRAKIGKPERTGLVRVIDGQPEFQLRRVCPAGHELLSWAIRAPEIFEKRKA